MSAPGTAAEIGTLSRVKGKERKNYRKRERELPYTQESRIVYNRVGKTGGQKKKKKKRGARLGIFHRRAKKDSYPFNRRLTSQVLRKEILIYLMEKRDHEKFYGERAALSLPAIIGGWLIPRKRGEEAKTIGWCRL